MKFAKSAGILALFFLLITCRSKKSILQQEISCDSFYQEVQLIHNQGKGKLSYNKGNISDFLLKYKSCIIGKKRGDIIKLLGTPIGGLSDKEKEPWMVHFSYVTTDNCHNDNDYCRQILLSVDFKSLTVRNIHIIY